MNIYEKLVEANVQYHLLMEEAMTFAVGTDEGKIEAKAKFAATALAAAQQMQHAHSILKPYFT